MSFFGNLIGNAAGAFVDKALGPIKDIALAWVNKEISEAEFEARVKQALISVFTTALREQSNIIRAEIESPDWMTRNWRPIVALTSFFSIWWVIFVIPHLVHWGMMSVSPKFGEVGLGWFFTLTSICVGGYIGGRSLEKMASIYYRSKK